MSNGGDDTDGERNDDDDVEETVSAEECDNWIPPLFFKAKGSQSELLRSIISQFLLSFSTLFLFYSFLRRKTSQNVGHVFSDT